MDELQVAKNETEVQLGETQKIDTVWVNYNTC